MKATKRSQPAPDPLACPAGGRVVRLDAERTREPCPVCGRLVQVHGRYDRRARAFLGVMPKHKRADIQAQVAGARKAGAELGRARCEAVHAARTAKQVAKRRACGAAPAFRRAEVAVQRLPPVERPRRIEQLTLQASRADRACVSKRHADAQRKLAEVPSDPRALLNKIFAASGDTGGGGFDVGAVEPDTFFEYLTNYLPQERLERIANVPAQRMVRAGLEALIAFAKPKTWDDLERRPFGGQESLMAVVRVFPGLEGLRLPDAAYALSADAAQWGEWDVGTLPF